MQEGHAGRLARCPLPAARLQAGENAIRSSAAIASLSSLVRTPVRAYPAD